MMRIGITGPESSGKTTLAEDLARVLGGALVPEYAREYLELNGPGYQYSDLMKIAKEQMRLIEKAKGDFVICDTEFLVLKIWSEEKFGHVDPTIESYFKKDLFDLYVLCSPDIPWEFDPLRENPSDRDRLFEKYDLTLNLEAKNSIVVSGDREKRLSSVLKEIVRLKKGK